MSLAPLELAAALLLPWLLGAAVLRALGIARTSDPLAFLGWAWLAGTLATALVVFTWSWLGPDYSSPRPAQLAVVALTAACSAIGARRAPAARLACVTGPSGERWLFRAALALVLAVLLQRVLLATLLPVITDDEAEFWALKAKALFTSGGFGARFAQAMADPAVYNEDYPSLNPLLQLWVFAHAGGIVHVANRLPLQLFALAQALIAASALRRVARPALAALFLLLLVAPGEARLQAGLAHGDLLVGCAALAAFDAWLRWRASGERAWLNLAALALGSMAWAKNEGLLYLVCIAIAFLLAPLVSGRPRSGPAAPRPRAIAALLAFPLGLIALHGAVNRHFGFRSGFVQNELRDRGILGLLVEQLPERGPAVLRYYAEELLLAPGASNLMLALLVALGLAFPLALARRELRLPLLAIAGALAATAAVFVGAPHRLDWHLGTAAARVVFQLVPAAVLWNALALGELGYGWARGKDVAPSPPLGAVG